MAVLAFLGTLVGAYFANRKSVALIAYRLEQLEEKVDKHNHLVERMYLIEKHEALNDEKLITVNQRLEKIEKGDST